MTDRRVRPPTLTSRPGSGRQPVITVVVLGGEFSGALAYALECALFAPAAVRAVRFRPPTGRAQAAPIPVGDMIDRPAGELVQLSACSDRMVAQCTGDEPDRLVVDLRTSTYSPFVEVDENGGVVRVSDPHGWCLPATARAAG